MSSANVEEKIMQSLDLSGYYSDYEGSRSCESIRNNALQKLPLMMRDLSRQGKISPLSKGSLIALTRLSKQTKPDEIRLFLEAIKLIIREHIAVAKLPAKARTLQLNRFNAAVGRQSILEEHIQSKRVSLATGGPTGIMTSRKRLNLKQFDAPANALKRLARMQKVRKLR